MIDWAQAAPAIGCIGLIVVTLIFTRRMKAAQRRRDAALRDRRGG